MYPFNPVGLILITASAVLLHGCSKTVDAGNADGSSGGGKLKVVTTIGMIADVTENIGGEHVQVEALMGPGVDPHLYKASEGDVTRLSSADLILYNGLHLEARMGDVLQRMKGKAKVVAVAEAIDPAKLLSPPEFEGQHDPHVWFDVSLWTAASEKIRDALIETDAAHADAYKTNWTRYATELQQLHEYVVAEAKKIPEAQRVVITAHDAFNYFGRAYGFEVRGLQGISTAAEAGTADVEALATLIAEKKIPAIFIESSVPRRNVEAVQEAVKAKGFNVRIGGELYSDAMGDKGTSEGTYLGMVRHNIDQVVTGLLNKP